MRKKTIQMVKIVWDCSGREEITWETEARMKADYPEWFNQFMYGMHLIRIRGRIPCKWGRLVASPILNRIVGTAMDRGNVLASLKT